MLLLFPQGQLGNQIFQYQFAKSIVKNGENIITSHAPYFSIIDESENKHFKFIPGKRIRKYVNFGCMKICEFLAKVRIISHIEAKKKYYDKYWIEKRGYIQKNGLIKELIFIDGFFINDAIHLQQSLKIKQKYLDSANKFLSKIPLDFKKIFIHVRRGDYLKGGLLGDMTLPISYYKNLIDKFLMGGENIAFIFLSDDIPWCREKFSTIKNSYFSNNNVGTDFAIMLLCDGGVISASTLSFLGGYYCKNKLEIFGPKYFCGFRKGIWFPGDINYCGFRWVSVL